MPQRHYIKRDDTVSISDSQKSVRDIVEEYKKLNDLCDEILRKRQLRQKIELRENND